MNKSYINLILFANSTTRIASIVFCFSVLSLVLAYTIEYGLGFLPCKLCMYQRYLYLFSIVITILYFICLLLQYKLVSRKNNTKAIKYYTTTNYTSFGIFYKNIDISKLYIYLVYFSMCFIISIAFFHYGIENNWWNYNVHYCLSHLDTNTSYEDYIKILSTFQTPCDIKTNKIFGLSITGLSIIYILLMFIIITILLIMHRYHNRKLQKL